jgi:leucyl/phenylalanyl-tRNA--protein transferase
MQRGVPPLEPPLSRFVMPDPVTMDEGKELVALGADLEPGTLLAAYRTGLFPMPVDPRKRRSKVAWYSPDPRGIIPLDGLIVSKSLRTSCRRFDVQMNTDFRGVMERCADPTRPGRWITPEFVDAYVRLAELGWAHSVETYRDGELVGGLYGVRINGFFAGESMFHDVNDASKVALVRLVEHLNATGAVLLDTQWTTDHLASLGAVEISRRQYVEQLADAIRPR